MADEQVLEGAETLTPRQQATFKRLMAEARVTANETAKADYEAKAEQAKLEASNEWKIIAEKHVIEIERLQPFEEMATKQAERDEATLKTKVKELGDAAKAAVAGVAGSAAFKLAWLETNKELFQASPGLGTPVRVKGNKPGPKPTGFQAGY